MGRRGFLALAGLFALSALVALVSHRATAPTVLKLAVGPIGSEDVRMAAAFVQSLNREKSAIRLKLVITDSLKASAAQIDGGEAELAIIRPDIALPTKGETVLITRRFLPFVIAARNAGIGRIADLRGRKVGVNNVPDGNMELLKTVLAFYEVPLTDVTIIGLSPADVPAAVERGDIDAVFAVGALSARSVSQGVANLRGAMGNDPVFIPIREAEALAARYRAIETGEIVRGAFGGDPPQPAEPLTTIAVTHRLVANADLSETVVAELTRRLLSQRSALSAEVPSVQGVEAPPAARDATLPVHTGTVAFLDGTERSFFDRYGDWFYLGVMAVSLLGSAAAGLLSQASQARRRTAMEGLNRIVTMIGIARETEDLSTLTDLEREADGILADTLSHMARQAIDDTGLSAYRLAMDQLSRAVSHRRQYLQDLELQDMAM